MCAGDSQAQSHSNSTGASNGAPVKVFLSYGRRDTQRLADRLKADLEDLGYQVWQDKSEIKAGREWEEVIKQGLQDTQVVLALLSPHAVRLTGDPGNPDNLDSVCLDELSYARRYLKPIVPVMAIPCEPPFSAFRLHYLNLVAWEDHNKYESGLQELREALERALAGQVRYRDWDFRLHPWDFSAFLDDKRQGLVGRTWLFRELQQWLDQGGEPAFLILGDPGIGKSAIVAELIHRNPPQLLAYHCCQADTPATLDPGRLVRSIAAMAAGRLPAYADVLLADPVVQEALSEASCAKDPSSAFEVGLLNPLTKIQPPGSGCHYLLIDALDESLARLEKGSTIVHMLASRLQRLPPWLRLVATARRETEILERLQGLKARELDAHDAQNLKDLQGYIEGRLTESAIQKIIESSPFSVASVLSILMERSQGIFLYAQQALTGLERGVYDPASLDQLPPGLAPLYRSFFERQFPDQDSFGEVRPILEIVAAAQEPLALEDLADVTGLDEDYELAPRLRRLATYLPARQGLHAFFHKSLSDWLTGADQQGSLYYVSVKKGHVALANQGWQVYQNGAAKMTRYMVLYLPAHLASVKRTKDLQHVLLDFTWMQAKLKIAGIQSLISDYELLPEDQDLQSIMATLQLSAHVLSPDPGQLASQLTGRLLAQKSLNIQWLLEEIRKNQKAPWLRPFTPSLAGPGGSLMFTLTGHNGKVRGVAVTSDGRRAVSTSSDKTLKVWDLESGQELRTLTGHSDWVNAVALTPNGRLAVSASNDKTLKVWDLSSGLELHTLSGHTREVKTVAVTSDSLRAVSGSTDRTIKVWDLETGRELANLIGHSGTIRAVALTTNCKQVVSASFDETLKVWDLETGKELRTFTGHNKDVRGVAITIDGQWVVSASLDKTLKVWDLGTGNELRTLTGHNKGVRGVALTPDSRQAVSASDDRTLKIWNLDTGKEIQTLTGHNKEVRAVAVTPDGQRAVSASLDESLKVWTVGSSQKLGSIAWHSGKVKTLALSPDDRLAVSGSDDKTLKVWDLVSGKEIYTLTGHIGPVWAVAVTPDSRRAISGSADKSLKVWDLTEGRELCHLSGHTREVRAVTVTSDGRRAVSASEDCTLKIWDLGTGQTLHDLASHDKGVMAVTLTRGGRRAFSMSWDRTLKAWDLDTGQELSIFTRRMRGINIMALIPDSNRVVSASGDNTLKVLDLESCHEIHTLAGHTLRVNAAILTLDGRRVISASWDNTLKVWELATEKCLASFSGDSAMTSCAASRDGLTLVAGEYSGKVHFLRLERV
jgi:WD40 repeat protein